MKKTLYIDYTHSIPVGGVKVHGGGNYTRTILINLINYLEEYPIEKRIVLLWPANHEPDSELEKKIFFYKKFEILPVNSSLDKIDFEIGSSLYIPLLGVKEYSILSKLKSKDIRIIMTIHGLRVLDYKFDKYNLMYANGLGEKIKAYVQEISLPLQKSIYKYNIKKYTYNIDALITVSNYTLSNLAKYTKIDNVVLQYEDTLPAVNPDEQTLKKYSGNYMLFVSGNRPEKNLARTIKAYKDYAQSNTNAIPLYVVGTNKSVRNALSKALSIQTEIENKKILFFDYVSDEELAALYTNATFLVYTSKSEGFGLPALEAARYGCPVMAAYGTSIPEVLGSNGKYINPYSTKSMRMGMDYMTDEAKRSYYKGRAKDVYMSILPKVRESNILVIKTLLEDV